MDRLRDKRVVLTGAGAGMGAAMLGRFLDEGAQVVAVSRTPERLSKRLEELDGDGRVFPISIDVTVPEAPDLVVETALAKMGGLDVVVNNAGIGDGFQLAGEVEEDVWRRTMEVNLDAPMRLCRRALQVFLEQRAGVFVAVSSNAGERGGRSGAAYTASKHGLIGLMRSIAATYFQDGIRANTIAPGWTATEMEAGAPLSRTGWSRFKDVAAINPRIAEAVEIADLAVFLAAEESRAVNGSVVTADSGWSVR
jgi:NAD(P)-dependent dehydrogenase (short-subunit alcohol dehydrogenase family)